MSDFTFTFISLLFSIAKYMSMRYIHKFVHIYKDTHIYNYKIKIYTEKITEHSYSKDMVLFCCYVMSETSSLLEGVQFVYSCFDSVIVDQKKVRLIKHWIIHYICKSKS